MFIPLLESFEDIFQPMGEKEAFFKTAPYPSNALGPPLKDYAEMFGLPPQKLYNISGRVLLRIPKALKFIKSLKLLSNNEFKDTEGQETEVREFKGYPVLTFRPDIEIEPEYIALHVGEEILEDLLKAIWGISR